MTKHAWALALTIGPAAAWLAWSIQRKRPYHIAAATVANLILWTLGPAFIIGVINAISH